MEWKTEIKKGEPFRVFEIKNQKSFKMWFFQFFAAFEPRKGAFGSNFKKKKFGITEYKLKVWAEKP